jgi:hypothetical protein
MTSRDAKAPLKPAMMMTSPLRVLLRELLTDPTEACLLPELADIVFGYLPFVFPVPASAEPTPGLLHWLGTKRGTAPWSNPALPPSRSVWISSKEHSDPDSLAWQLLLEPRATHGYFTRNVVDGANVEFNFGFVHIQPWAFTVQYHPTFAGSIRTWQLEGSLDRIDWTVLHSTPIRSSAVTPLPTFETWTVTPSVVPLPPRRKHGYLRKPGYFGLQICGETGPSLPTGKAGTDLYYRYIRLRYLTPDDNRHHLWCQALELYGAVLVDAPVWWTAD